MSVKKRVKIELDENEKIIDFPMKKTEIMMEKEEKRSEILMEEGEKRSDIVIEEVERRFLLDNPEKEEEPEFNYNFLICCWRRPILVGVLIIEKLKSYEVR